MGIAKHIKSLAFFLVLITFVISIACSWGSVETIYHFKTQTTQCPISEAQTGCPTVYEHISSLQILATTLPNVSTVISLLFILLLVVVFGSGLRNKSDIQGTSIGHVYNIQNPELSLFNHLKLAFAQGILNPKIY